MAVPIKRTAIAVGVVLATGGAMFALASDQQTSSTQSGDNKQSEQKADVQGVVENPPVDVKINGQEVPVQPGRTSVDTGNGEATVSVNNNRVEVNQTTSRNGSGNVDVQITSHTTGNTNTTTRYRTSTRSSSESSNSSKVDISTDGDGTVKLTK